VGVVSAAVAGTFLYIAIVEIGVNELRLSRAGQRQLHAAKLLAFIVGYGAMSYLAVWV
jgi:hypothetical protein